jgi:hypothetical protein
MREELIDLAERLSYEIESEVGDLRFGINDPIPANYVKWAVVSVRNGFFLTADWACDWIRKGYPEPPQWLVERRV